MARVVLSKNFDPNNVVFASKMNAMNDGGTVTSCKLSYNYPEETIGGVKYPAETSRLIIQSAKMKNAFGVKSGEKFGNPNKWNINLSFRGEDKKKSIVSFRAAYESLDEAVIQAGLAKPDTIGGGHTFDDEDDETLRKKMIRKGYSSRIKKAKNTEDTDYPDTLRIDVPWDREKQTPRDYVQFYNEANEKADWELSQTSGSDVVCLFEANQVWSSTVNNTFGTTVKLIQIKMYNSGSTGKVTSFQIQNEIESDDEVDDSGSESIDVDAAEVESVDYIDESE